MTGSPEQIVLLLVVIDGFGFTVTITWAVLLHPVEFVPVTVYVVVTVGVAVTVAPVVGDNPVVGDQLYVLAPDALRGVLEPEHIEGVVA